MKTSSREIDLFEYLFDKVLAVVLAVFIVAVISYSKEIASYYRQQAADAEKIYYRLGVATIKTLDPDRKF